MQVLCLQCDEELVPMSKPRLYCGMACEQEAEIVRYIRRCSKDGRLEQPDVQDAIQIRLAHIVAGGYDKNARKLSKEQRTEVVVRSDGLCVVCGKPGIEIDHIKGPSDDQANLQLLCKDCHDQKTFANIVPVRKGSPEYKRIKVIFDRVFNSAESKNPKRPCHDEVTWPTKWREYQKSRSHFVLPRK